MTFHGHSKIMEARRIGVREVNAVIKDDSVCVLECNNEHGDEETDDGKSAHSTCRIIKYLNTISDLKIRQVFEFKNYNKSTCASRMETARKIV